jgi:hypothetical protein
VLLAEPVSPSYLGWARAQVDAAAMTAGRPEPQIAVYTWCCAEGDSRSARERVILLPLPGDELAQLRVFAQDVRPLLL